MNSPETTSDQPAGPRPSILIVDDDSVIRLGLQTFLSRSGYETTVVEDGAKALDTLKVRSFDMVLSDIEMPKLSGLELLGEAKRMARNIPFVMISGRASMEHTIEALRLGAVNFVRKPYSLTEILEVVKKAVEISVNEKERDELLGYVTETKTFEIPSRIRHIKGLVQLLSQDLPSTLFSDIAERWKVRMAVEEAATNAHEHGNMELPGASRNFEGYASKLRVRETQPPYANRKIHACRLLSRDAVTYTFRDEGPGFDHTCLPNPHDPENLYKMNGRGIMLMRLVMDEVRFNDKGNEIVMVKRGYDGVRTPS